MADFAPDATPRYKALYRNGGRNHSVQVRVARGTSLGAGATTARNIVGDVFGDLAAILFEDFAWTGAFYYVEDSNVALPAASPPAVTGTVALADGSNLDKISALHFAGKGALGSKAGFSVFGVQFSPDEVEPVTGAPDFVFFPGDSAVIDAARGTLAGATDLVAIDNSNIFWYARVTYKPHDHWVKRVRNGS